MAIKTGQELANACLNVAKHYKTLYVNGCFGAPMTSTNKARYVKNTDFNRAPERTRKINNASADTFGFDCVCLIKGLLWGWSGDKSAVYGGAKYASNGVKDTNADGMIKLCSGVSKDFKNVAVGEALWMPGHIGIYIGKGLAVECTPIWKDGVQVTAVGNIGRVNGYNTRTWTSHGKLPYVTYTKTTIVKTENTKPKVEVGVTKVVASKGADKKDAKLSASYKTTADLHLRDGAGVDYKSLVVMPKGTSVRCYGYYTVWNGVKWYYVQTMIGKTQYTGFCSSKYLKKG